jgi:hypothetical protein
VAWSFAIEGSALRMRRHGKRFVVPAEEKATALLELESATSAGSDFG